MATPRSILIAEDEPLIAMVLEDFLISLGHAVVGTCESVAQALEKAGEGGFDVAILDVHLKGGEHIWPVTDLLADKGIPFVLATGGHVDPPPERHAGAPVLAKPYSIDSIEPTIERACGAA